MADRLVVIGKGRLLADTTAAELAGEVLAPRLGPGSFDAAGDSAIVF